MKLMDECKINREICVFKLLEIFERVMNTIKIIDASVAIDDDTVAIGVTVTIPILYYNKY